MSRYDKMHLVRRHLSDAGLNHILADFACLDNKEQLVRHLGSGTQEVRSHTIANVSGLAQIEGGIRQALAQCIASLLPEPPPERTLNVSKGMDYDGDTVKDLSEMVLVSVGGQAPADFVERFKHSMIAPGFGTRDILLKPGTLKAACAFVPGPVSRAKAYSGGGVVKVYVGASLPSKGSFEDYIVLVNQSSEGKFDEFLKYSRSFGD